MLKIKFCRKKPTKYLYICRNISTFVVSSNELFDFMKYSEFHRKVKQQGWVAIRQTGSHRTYEKDGQKVSVPYHGSKEIPKGLKAKLEKELGL